MGLATAVIGGAIIGAGATAYSGSKASKAQKKAAKQASATELQMYNQNRADTAPQRGAGYKALNELLVGLGLDPEGAPGANEPLSYEDWSKQNLPQGGAKRSDGIPAMLATAGGDVMKRAAYENYRKNFKPAVAPSSTINAGYFNDEFDASNMYDDPGYQFRLDQGNKNLMAGAAADGSLQSGATLKALTRYGQDYASGEYSSAYSRFNADRDRRFNRLSSLAGMGQTATENTARMGADTAGRIGEYQLQAGNARAARNINTGNAINDTVGSIGQYYLQKQFMKPSTDPGVYV